MSRKGPTGFIETLKKKNIKTPIINTNVCLPIYMNGMNSNKINFLQSEFPNLTKIKPLIQNSVKTKTNNKNKKTIQKTIQKTKKNKDFTTPIKKKVRFAS